MKNRDIVISRGIVRCKQTGGAFSGAIPYLFFALSKPSRKKLENIFSTKELKLLARFVKENESDIVKYRSL